MPASQPHPLLRFNKGASVEPSIAPIGLIPSDDGHGQLHLCFAILALQPDAGVQHLEPSGVQIESRAIQSRDGSLHFRDPDGHSLAVGTLGLWRNHW